MSEQSVKRHALTTNEARALTARIRQEAIDLWADLLRAYQGDAHSAMGYGSWGAYCQVELEVSDGAAYRLLNAARVVEQLPNGSRPQTEAVARELAPLRDQPEQLREAWTEAVEQHGPQPTAAQVRDVVTPLRPAPEPHATPPTRADTERAAAGLSEDAAAAIAARDALKRLAPVSRVLGDLSRNVYGFDDWEALDGLGRDYLTPEIQKAERVEAFIETYLRELRRRSSPIRSVS